MDLLVLPQLHQLLMVLLLLPNLKLVSSDDVKWRSYPVFDGKLPVNGFTISSLNQLHCGRTCSENDTCISFSYAPGQELNCQLHDHILASTEGLAEVTKARYYVLYGAPVPAMSVTTHQTSSTVSITSTTTSFSSSVTSTSVSPLATSSVPVTATTNVPCPADMYAFNTVSLSDNNTFTFKVVNGDKNFSDSVNVCAEDGAYLARVTTVAKMDMLRHLLKECMATLSWYRVDGSNIDAADYHAAGAWVTLTGDPLPMTSEFWEDGFPMIPQYSHCLMINPFKNYKWQELGCSSDIKFVCEK